MTKISLHILISLPIFGGGRIGVFLEEKWLGLLGINRSSNRRASSYSAP